MTAFPSEDASPTGDTKFFARGRAKINLTLHISGRRPDGYHALESLVAFAGVADRLAYARGEELSLTMEGSTAQAAGAGSDNLVLRAARALEARVPGLRMGAFHLTKILPVAAGIGGGSSDAAAALRLLAAENGLAHDDARLIDAARTSGADVPVCLVARAKIMTGTGEILGPVLRLPPLYAVLVNPGVKVETAAVFAKLGLQKGENCGFGAHPHFTNDMDSETFFNILRKGRNDMEDAACVIAPVISDVLAVLGAARGCKLARMSGSGATCFALFANRHQALRAARVIARDHADWWVTATTLR